MVRFSFMLSTARRILSNALKSAGRQSLLVLALAATAGLIGCSSSEPEPKWNVLMVVPDTVRGDRLSAGGYARETTPNVDRLAREGALFTQAYTTAPRTWQSYVTILTGLYPPHHGVRFINDYPLDKKIPTLAAMLGKAGYDTKSFDVVPFVRSMLDGQGFDEFYDHKVTPDEEMVFSDAWDWMQAKRKRPFFAFIRTSGGHWPYRADPGDYGFGNCEGKDHRFNDFSWRLMGVIPSPKRGAGVLLKDPEAYRKFNLELDYDEATLQHIAEHYDAEIRLTDTEVGALLDRMRSSGLLERTVIVFTADHGESLGEHGYLQHGPRVDEPVMHVPLVIRLPEKHPSRNPGVKIDGVVRTVDILPTVLDAVGQPIPKGLDGVSLLPAMTGKPLPDLWAYGETGRVYAGADPEIYIEGVAGKHRMVRQGGWKLIYVPKPGMGEHRLYDLKKDPGEHTNVASEHPEVVKQLMTHLDSILSSDEDTSSRQRDLTESEKEQLRALGYM